MKASKKWVLIIVICTVVTLSLCATATVVSDPLLQYHEPLPFYTSFYREEAYINPGIVKTETFHTVLVGTSTTQNTDMDYFRETLHNDAIKLIYSGGTTLNFKTILDLAFDKQDLEAVYWGLDISTLLQSYTSAPVEMPQYLYDDDLLNDAAYLLNKDILIKGVFQNTLDSLQGKISDPVEDTETWLPKAKFGKEHVLKDYNPDTTLEPLAADAYLQTVQENLEYNILPLIQQHPDVTFTFFAPPPSIVYWDYTLQEGKLDAVIEMLSYTYEALLQNDHVRVFFFQDQEEWITNLDNYTDTLHFKPDFNLQMVEMISRGENELTLENYRERLDAMKDFVLNFDFEACYAGK